MPRLRSLLFIIAHNGVPMSDTVVIDRQFVPGVRRAKMAA